MKSPISLEELKETLDDVGIRERKNFLLTPPPEALQKATEKSIAQIFVEYGLFKTYPMPETSKYAFVGFVEAFGIDEDEAALGESCAFPLFFVHASPFCFIGTQSTTTYYRKEWMKPSYSSPKHHLKGPTLL